MRIFMMIMLCVLGLRAIPAWAEDGQEVPRTVIALYDDRGAGIRTAFAHTIGTMPLNHLGIRVEYHDIHKPLPPLDDRRDVRGILTWFLPDTTIPHPDDYLRWSLHAIKLGKKFVVMSQIGLKSPGQEPFSPTLAAEWLKAIGMVMPDIGVNEPLDAHYTYGAPEMFLEHQPFRWRHPPYDVVKAADDGVTVHLAAHTAREGDSALILTSPAGGYAASGYAYRTTTRFNEEVPQWIINPFEFFRAAFATDDLPKPDTTTIAGRRIYYSHIDGDGWNNMTHLQEYRNHPTLSSEVILEKAIKAYPDLPVSVTIIAADIDPEAAMTKDSRRIAEEFFSLPNVEAGTHTYSHPFYWQLFKDGDPAKEIPYLPNYSTNTWKPTSKEMRASKDKVAIPTGYDVPRAYAYKRFDLDREVTGALKEVSALLPPGKKLALYTWSGNCAPWEDAVRLTREGGVRNINGGDTRFDMSYPAYAGVAPVGIPLGKEWQVYASMSNEITYTNIWSANLYAYRYLIQTIENTESPVRLKPMNVYYHIFSGENEAAFNALLNNLDYAHTHSIAPIAASRFTEVAQGFFDARLTLLSPDTWRVENRRGLETVRFDRAAFRAVDFGRSKGVVGQRHFQGSLYVYLDEAVDKPVVALKANDHYYAPPEESVPYLSESRWLVSGVKRHGAKLEFDAQGYGAGEMVWQMPADGGYSVHVGDSTETIAATQDRTLHIKLEEDAIHPVHIVITPASGKAAGNGGNHA